MDPSKLIFHTLTFFACMAVGCQQVMAQEINEHNFTHYSEQDGLPNNTITGMAQDSTGYIWISTFSGLNRFNGCSFVPFNSHDSLAQPTEFLRGLKWLDNHRLAAYGGGAMIVDTRTGESRNLYIPYKEKKYQYKFNGIRALKGSPGGDIFMLSYAGFYHFDKDYKLVFRYDHYPDDSVATTNFSFGRQLFWLDGQRLLVVSMEGLYCYDTGKKVLKKMEAADCPLLAEFLDYTEKAYLFFQDKPGCFFITDQDRRSIRHVNIPAKYSRIAALPFKPGDREFGYRTEMVAISDSILYLTGHESGFYRIRLDPGTGQVSCDPKKYFPHYFCRQLLQDKDHNLWVATNKGLMRQDDRLSFVRQVPIPLSLQEQFPNITMQGLYVADDKLYVSTRGNGGLLVYNKENLQFVRRISLKKYFASADNVYVMERAGDSNLLVGTNGPLFRLDLRTGRTSEVALDKWDRPHDWTSDLYKDRQENVWLAAGHIYRYDAQSQHFSVVSARTDPFSKIQEANLITQDADGNIWIAGHGIYRYNTSTRDFDKLIDSLPFIKIPDRRILAFTADRHRNLWINSYNNGLICYHIDKGVTRLFTRDDGLPDNNIAAMIVIGDKLWMATYSGISCLDLQTYKITSFGKEDGFPTEPIAIGAKFSYDIARSRLYIGFSNTIVEFDPDIIFQRSHLPHLFIESLATGYEKERVYPSKDVTLSWKNNDIRLTIGNVNFFTSASQRYAYRLMQDDSTPWQDLGTQNSLSISSLSPGTHRIQVKLSSLNNRWPEQVKEIDITILPPFWKQPWFLVLSVMGMLTAVILLIRWRTGLTRKKEQAKTHIQKLKADEYKNQFELEQISNYFSSFLAHKKDVDEVLWDVAKNLIGRMKYSDCMIYLWNEDRTKMVQKASYGPKGNPKAIHESTFDVLPGQGVVGYVMQTWEPLLIPNTREDRRYRVDDLRRLSEICVPIIHNNELIGIIDSEHPTGNYYKERDLQILTTIATLVGNKIKQIESEHHLEIKQKEIASINQQLAEAQLSALQTQMNPHFIFNSLNSIKGMILENQQQKASRYLSKFAQMIRITLNQSKEIFTTLYENTEHLENYLMMEKLRFDDSFTFRIIVDEQIDKEETLIPTMMIQPLAENAIWHGLMPKKGDKRLSIRFSLEENTICCAISDNGIGINQAEASKRVAKAPHQSVGLNNLRNRIKIMNEKYDAGCSLEITDLSDLYKEKTGTRVVLRFNVITTKPCL